jgi:hypothetical protein
MSSCFRFENEMVPRIVNTLSTILNQDSTIVWTTEFIKGYRQIDIIVASMNGFAEEIDETATMIAGLRRLTYTQMEVLSFMGSKGHVSPLYLAKKTWLSLDVIKRYIADFIGLGLVEKAGRRSYRPTLWIRQLPKCIISIETKLSDWNTALKQALYNKPGVDFSYVAFPFNKFSGRKAIIDEFQRRGVGVLGISESGISEVLAYPRREPIDPVDYLITAIKVRKELSFSDKWTYLQI